MAKSIPWTKEQEEWLANNYSLPHSILVESFYKMFRVKRTKQAINHKLSRIGKLSVNIITKEQIQWLKENYPNCVNTQQLVKDFNSKFNTYYDRRGIAKICSDKKISKNIRSKNIKARKPLGHEKTSWRDGSILIKYKDEQLPRNKAFENYMPKSRYMYERYHHCKLKKGDIVIFLDGNNRNFDKSNLELVSRQELGQIDGYGWRVNSKVTKAGIELLRTEKLIKDME